MPATKDLLDPHKLQLYVMPMLNIGQGDKAHSAGAVVTKFGLALTIDIFSAVVACKKSKEILSGSSQLAYNCLQS